MTSDDGSFLGRWSRRKQAARAVPAPVAAQEPEAAPELPPIESLGPTSNYAAFLQKGVAAEVQRLALRQAWSSDAAIANFRGMADYDWDFNASTYGRLWASDDVGQLLRAVLSSPAAATVEEAPPQAVEAPAAASVRTTPAAPPTPAPNMAALEAPASAAASAEPPASPAPRRHGSARPV